MHKTLMGDVQTDWLSARKKALKVSNAKLGEAIGVDGSVASRILHGHVTFSKRYVPGIAKALEISPEEVLYRFGLIEEVAAPDTPATAWEPDLALLTKTIEGALPYVWAGRGDPDIAPKVAQMIAAVSHAVAMNPAILDTEASTAQAVQVVGVSIFGGPPPPTPSKPSTQRHKSDNS